MAKRKRRFGSIKKELIKKSKEAALAAVQIYNNPNISFKSEIFIVMMHIAWTYLMHAYYRGEGIEYRYHEKTKGGRRKFDKTKRGAYKYWELERCLNDDNCPLDKNTKNNLRFLIELRHEIEHQMTTKLIDYMSARFQACCLNYNFFIKELFDKKYALDNDLNFSLQFSKISKEQKQLLTEVQDLPENIQSLFVDFDQSLTVEEYNHPRFAYRVIFIRKNTNNPGKADRVIEFVDPEDKLSQELNKTYAVIKDRERPKYLPGQIVKEVQEKGFSNFKMHHHTRLWKSLDARRSDKGYGVWISKKWYWYESWKDKVFEHVKENREMYQ